MAPGQQGCSRPPRSQHRRHNGRAAAGCRAERPRQKAVSLPPQKPQVHPGGGTSELAPLHRRDSGSQARGEGNGVRRETPPTPPCTCPRRRHTRAHVCTANPTQRKRREPSPAGVPGWSAARGKGGQETPHSPQRTGPSPPQGPQRLHIGAPRPQAPPSRGNEPGLRHLGTHAHMHTSAHPRVHGAQMPYLVDCSPWKRSGPSRLQPPPEGSKASRAWGSGSNKGAAPAGLAGGPPCRPAGACLPRSPGELGGRRVFLPSLPGPTYPNSP